MKLFALTCTKFKKGYFRLGATNYLSHAFAESESEARGQFLAAVMDMHDSPDLEIQGLQVREIPTEQILEHFNPTPEKQEKVNE